MIRNHLLPISGYLHSRLALAAEISGLPNVETLVELWLTDRLDADPGLLELDAQLEPLRKERKQIIAKWKLDHKKT